MNFQYNEKEGEVTFSLEKAYYSGDHLPQAAYVFSKQATAFMSETPTAYEVTLKSKTPGDVEALRKLGGEFLNELISEERRKEVFTENKRIIELIVTQALYSAQQTPEQEAEAARITAEMKPEADRLIAEIRAETEKKVEVAS